MPNRRSPPARKAAEKLCTKRAGTLKAILDAQQYSPVETFEKEFIRHPQSRAGHAMFDLVPAPS